MTPVGTLCYTLQVSAMMKKHLVEGTAPVIIKLHDPSEMPGTRYAR
jgi:hypothetical protein